MFNELKKAVGVIEKVVGAMDAATLEPVFAMDLVELFSKAENIAASGKAIASERVASSGTWKKQGDRSAAHFIARATGDSVGRAVVAIETARRMADLPKAEEAFRSGRLTFSQAAEIASAACVSPGSETKLLEVAKAEGIVGLRQECQRVRAHASLDEVQRAERLHRSRYLRTWCDHEGAFRLDARLAPEAGAEVRATLDALRDTCFNRARRQGLKEPYQALEADALLEMSRAARSGGNKDLGPKAMVNVRVDHAALLRGHAQEGEVCEVQGVGPISVTAARALTSDSILKVLVCKGDEVTRVAHLGRTIPVKVRSALAERDRKCVISACSETRGLEIDHVIPLAEGGETSLENLVRICAHHHRLKTYQGFVLTKDKGRWRLGPPEDAKQRVGAQARE